MDGLDIVLAVLKFVGIVAAAVFGVIAISCDFKDQEGKVTRAGRVALSGVIVAALLATGSHTVEVLKARRDADATAKKTEKELAQFRQLLDSVNKTTNEVQRSLELIDLNDLRFGFCLKFSIDDPAFVAYKTRLEAKCAELRNELENTGKRFADDLHDNLSFGRMPRIPLVKEDGQLRHVLIVRPGSTLWPDHESPEERIAANMVGRCGMILEFNNQSCPEPDYGMEMIMGGTLDGSPGPADWEPIDASIRYISEDRTLAVHARGAENFDIVEPTKEFLSIVDFEGAKVRITLANLMNEDDYAKLVPSISLRSFTVSCGEKRRSVSCQNIQKVESEDGLTFSGTLSRE